MTLKKFFLYLSILIAILAILPLPLALFVDKTYHWLLIVTIPVGAILFTVSIVLWAVIKEPKKLENKMEQSTNGTQVDFEKN